MDFLTLAKERYSVRKFKPEPIPEPELVAVLSAGRLAPTACNLQPQRIFVIRSSESLAKIRRCSSCHFDAPVVLMICYDRSESWKRSFDGFDAGAMDATIVTTHLMLAAAEQGLGTTWVCFFDPKKLRQEFSLPEQLEPVALLPIGFPADDAVANPVHFKRKELSQTVFFC